MEYKSDTLFIFASSSHHLWKVQNCSISIFLCRWIDSYLTTKNHANILAAPKKVQTQVKTIQFANFQKESQQSSLLTNSLEMISKQSCKRSKRLKGCQSSMRELVQTIWWSKRAQKELIRIVPSWNVLLKLSSKAVKQIWKKFSFCWWSSGSVLFSLLRDQTKFLLKTTLL